MAKTNRLNLEMIDLIMNKMLIGMKDEDNNVLLDDFIVLTDLRCKLMKSYMEERTGKITGDQVLRSLVTIGGLTAVIGFEQYGGIITSKAFSLLKGLGGGA